MISQKIIDLVKNKIIELEDPAGIILFGSYAKGNANDNSDLDLLIVKNTNLPRFKRAANLYKNLAKLHLSMDLIVKTEDEVKANLENPRSFDSRIFKEGISLYEKQIS